MAYIKHNVNMYLLFLMLFTATSLVGASVFFQHRFESMVAAYDTQINQVNELAEELALKQGALADVEKDLKLKEAREARLSQINERLANSKEQPAEITGATVVDNSQPKVRTIQTSTGTGFSARPKRSGFLIAI
ncbi:hypothetical protein HY484_02875 [Candidatus Woesearchaeota archaeon]|nr:hypothetical protein [Candidatus Woesearchaeota archaeon]